MAYDFEESSGQRITYSPNADYSSYLAFSVWLKWESLPGSHQAHIISKGKNDSGADRNFSFLWTPASGGLIRFAWSNPSGSFSEWDVANNPSTGAWQHWYGEVDWTTNPDAPVLWMNGSSISLSNSFGGNDRTPLATATQQLSIGGEHGSTDNNNNFDGLIAEVALWNDLGGSTRMAGMYNSGAGGKADTLYPTNLTEYIRLKDDTTNAMGGSGTLSSSAPTLSGDHPFSDPSAGGRRLFVVS